jgi:hypothetical protein
MLKLNWFYISFFNLNQFKVQRNRRDRVEILTFLNAGKQVSGSTIAHSNTNAFFWKVLTLPVKSYWMQHISSFLSSDLSVSRTFSRLLLIILLSLRIHYGRKCFRKARLSSELGYTLTTFEYIFQKIFYYVSELMNFHRAVVN